MRFTYGYLIVRHGPRNSLMYQRWVLGHLGSIFTWSNRYGSGRVMLKKRVFLLSLVLRGSLLLSYRRCVPFLASGGAVSGLIQPFLTSVPTRCNVANPPFTILSTTLYLTSQKCLEDALITTHSSNLLKPTSPTSACQRCMNSMGKFLNVVSFHDAFLLFI